MGHNVDKIGDGYLKFKRHVYFISRKILLKMSSLSNMQRLKF